MVLADKVGNRPLAVLAMAGLYVVFGVAGAALGWLVNQSGRHYFMGHPVQFATIPLFVFAWIAVAFSAGMATAPWVGWVVFVSPLAALIAWPLVRQWRRMRGGLDDRQAYAESRQWRYTLSAPELAGRYGTSPGADKPYGVVYGETGGIAFTAWDTFSKSGMRRTTWALHLPAAFDPVSHRHGALTSANPGLAAYLWTDQVAAVTQELSLAGWFLHGTDLVFTRQAPKRPGFYTGTQIAEGAAVLVHLVRAFPADLPARFGHAVQA
jgi:hypothetical protein